MNNKRIVFVNEYLKCWNASEAARRAGYKKPGSQGHRLLNFVEIKEAIAKRLEEITLSSDEVLTRLAEQARADHTEFLDTSGNIHISRLVTAGKAHLVKSIKQTQWGRQIEFYDAQAALVHLGKHHGLFIEKGINVNVSVFDPKVWEEEIASKQLSDIVNIEEEA
jgi:hypothetical protein